MKKIKLVTFQDATEYIQIANNYEGDINITFGSITLDGKSISGLFGLGLSKVLDIRLISDNTEECERFYKDIEKWEV
jgi:phosphotransferase system HPr-like phosphotransfer protein